MKDLTEKQKQLLIYIRENIQQRIPPYSQIMRDLGIRHKNSVHQILQVLEIKGYLRREEGKQVIPQKEE